MKDKNAVNLGKLSWEKRKKTMNKKERSEYMSKMAKTKWDKIKKNEGLLINIVEERKLVSSNMCGSSDEFFQAIGLALYLANNKQALLIRNTFKSDWSIFLNLQV